MGIFSKKEQSSALIGTAAAVIIIAGVMAAQSVIIPILLAVFISIISAQPVMWMEKRKVPSALAILIVLLVIVLFFFLFGGVIGNSLARFSQNAPQYENRLSTVFINIIDGLNTLGFNLSGQQFLEMIDPGKILNFTAGAVSEIGSIMSDSFLILLISVFMLSELKSFWVKAEIIEKQQNQSLKHLDEIGKSIRHYLTMKTWISLATGVFIAVWLLIVGVDYPILWGLIAFLLNYIPNIGSIIAAVPTMLLALIQLGPGGMFSTALGYLIVNLVMGNIVEPKVMGKGLGLSTLVVFLSLIIWGFVFGSVGMFLSIPLTMSIKIMLAQNEKTKWVAVLLGTEENATSILEGNSKV